ncbi:histidine phosphatase family protein [Evansella sp. LMS18]|jgi:probable phosphoglycerate mutase|uniref:histidine phosphatase family protein n=1 Tax=Evansella sp. LMS18 TaxID=2924033 RepID=UPI0020CFF0FF|nr:histidine phosphatase family protein [Evansella sp. LMS18]UTR09996.1 histidine phosphatase family protein [Evansella sp. LMS18]
MLKLYITRHGETVWNTEKRMQGWGDSELTESGVRNAEFLSNRLKNIDFAAIYSSPSKRARLTAELIKGERELPVILEDNLKEIHLGEWEGRTVTEIEKTDPDRFHSFWKAPHLYEPQGGESYEELRNRLTAFLKNAEETHPSGDVLVVTHSAVIKMLSAIFKELPLEKLWDPPYIHDTSLTIVEVDGHGYNIHIEGDISHRLDVQGTN